MSKIKLGVFGFGCVGQGLYNVLQNTKGVHAEIHKICIKHPEKARTLPPELFTTQASDIILNPEIDVVVELIDDADAAYEIVKASLKQKKAVVSANKKMIAEHLEELVALQREYETPLLYEGSCCASIPIIRNLEEYYDNDLLQKVEGIFNGSTNYILTKIFDENQSFDDALKDAQALGFAESDPILDVGAFDPKYKLCILLLHAFGLFTKPEQIFNHGIQKLNAFDVQFARSQNAQVKLIASCTKSENEIFAYCIPHLIKNGEPLQHVKNEYNAVNVESVFSEHQTFFGKGAGDKPTGSAVVSDISALTYRYKYEYKKHDQNKNLTLSGNTLIKLYVRFTADQKHLVNDFESIEQEFNSAEANYIVGKIYLHTLKNAAWTENLGVNLIAMN